MQEVLSLENYPQIPVDKSHKIHQTRDVKDALKTNNSNELVARAFQNCIGNNKAQ